MTKRSWRYVAVWLSCYVTGFFAPLWFTWVAIPVYFRCGWVLAEEWGKRKEVPNA